MTETLRSSLSALSDDVAGEFEYRKVISDSESCSELLAIFNGYQTVGAVLRGERLVPNNMLSRINSELDRSSNLISDEVDTAGDIDVGTYDVGKCAVEITFLPAEESWLSRARFWTGQFLMVGSVSATILLATYLINPSKESVDLSEPALVKFEVPVQKELVSFSEKSYPSMEYRKQEINAKLALDRLGAYIERHAENSTSIGIKNALPLARVMGSDGF